MIIPNRETFQQPLSAEEAARRNQPQNANQILGAPSSSGGPGVIGSSASSGTARLNEILDPLDFFGGQASRQAADIQTQLAQMGLDLERDFFNQLREDEAPVREVRDQALGFLQQLQEGTAQLPTDPSLAFQEENALRDINQAAAAGGRSLAGGTRMAEQDALASLRSNSTNNQLNRVLNLAGFQTSDLLGQNSLIAQNTDAQANQMNNLQGIRNAAQIGQSNAIFNTLGQGARLAGSII